MHHLKYAFNESDESLVARWVENPYWQYFCGFEFLQHELPLHPTSMGKWRKRVGAKRLEALLEETILVAKETGIAKAAEFHHVNVDTTVQEISKSKKNEVSSVLELIDKLEINDITITADAMSCLKKVTKAIDKKGLITSCNSKITKLNACEKPKLISTK